ncbi:hypothetical protein B0A48_04463 [Cryoendolithus antarcticus]|uniref:DUF7704 domain-containing protein n=1 Tax=Cryoendolithus antarcticus TaxID=1507870 RepID=A0A1V8TFE8_9PEZI|nr:hypothetical protein B0A48_04463 [Cryoendolithus antarcticus]
MAPPIAIKASTSLPSVYRFLLTNVEPVFTLMGILFLLSDPLKYSSMTTRELVTTLDPGASFIYTQLAGAWCVIAFTEGVLLRQVDDLRVWRLVCVAMLCSDALYTHSLAQAVGGWAVFVDLAEWTANDWIAAVGTIPFVLVRLAIVSGVGVRSKKVKR